MALREDLTAGPCGLIEVTGITDCAARLRYAAENYLAASSTASTTSSDNILVHRVTAITPPRTADVQVELIFVDLPPTHRAPFFVTKSEAERRKLDFIAKLEINSREYQIPSAHTFADAAKYYQEKSGPRLHRESTRSVWEGRIKNHLEPDWKDVPLDLITFDAVSEWGCEETGRRSLMGNG